jgi:hypothetical protein
LYALLMLELWHQSNGAAGRGSVGDVREAVVDSAGRATEE